MKKKIVVVATENVCLSLTQFLSAHDNNVRAFKNVADAIGYIRSGVPCDAVVLHPDSDLQPSALLVRQLRVAGAPHVFVLSIRNDSAQVEEAGGRFVPIASNLDKLLEELRQISAAA